METSWFVVPSPIMLRSTALALCLAGAMSACTFGNEDPLGHGNVITSGTAGATTATSTVASSSSGATSSSSASGGIGGDSATFDVSLDDASADMNLDEDHTFTVTLAPNGFSGTVTLSASGLEDGVSAAFDDATLTLDGSASATTTLTLTTASSAAPGDHGFSVVASSDEGSASASVALTVKSVITIHIPQDVDDSAGTVDNPNKAAFGPYPITITAPAGISDANPVTVKFFNDDDVAHQIHAGNPDQGFPHDNTATPGNSADATVRKVNATGTYNFYLHDEGQPKTVGRIVIQ